MSKPTLVAAEDFLKTCNWRKRGEEAALVFRTGISWRILAKDGFELFKKTSITAPPPSVDAHDPAENWDASTRRASGSTLRRAGAESAGSAL